ncbi:MAG: phosphoribosyltransferase [Thainema sp.]
MSQPLFKDRVDAGLLLAAAIWAEREAAIARAAWTDPIVYGLPKGGVPIAEQVAQRLACPLDIVVAKKITEPSAPELAIGAVTTSGQVVYPSRRIGLNTESSAWQTALSAAQATAQAQEDKFMNLRPQVSPTGKIAIIIDDGIATGMTIAAAIKAIRAQHPAQVWVGAPVAPPQILPTLDEWCDRSIILATPDPFFSVSRFYQDFPQTTPQEVADCLAHQYHWLASSN